MRYDARLVVLVGTSDIERLRQMATDRGWSLAQMTRHLLTSAIRQEDAKAARRRGRERGKGPMSAAKAAGIVSLQEMGLGDAGN